MGEEEYIDSGQQPAKPGVLYFTGLVVFTTASALLAIWAFIVLALA
ncbi:MAG TPA: hypothetical protein VD735_01380 [Candidatus Saccharimonadales bacterium]|nr:hypothetical protein [Candidatus Saccharimonadales bacterium]